MTGMIMGGLALVVGQIVGALLAPVLVNPIKQFYALREVRADPDQYGIGTEYDFILRPGADKEWIGPCRVVGIRKGKMTVQGIDPRTGQTLPYMQSASCREFIDFHPRKRL